MTKLQKAIKLKKYLNQVNPWPTYRQMIIDLGWAGQISISQMRLFALTVNIYDIEEYSYCREMRILMHLSRNTSRYLSASQIIYDLDLVDRVTPRSIRRYIKAIIDSGYEIETKKGGQGGYKLKTDIDF